MGLADEFADRDPSKRLQTIRHALSLDDERPTFRPVLWNEVVKDHAKDRRAKSSLRIRSSRFGLRACMPMSAAAIPDDGLAFTALDWMMEEAAAVGLRYDPKAGAKSGPRQSAGRAIQFSRGIAGYYRYGPRRCRVVRRQRARCGVPTVRVHPEARPHRSWVRDYAPVSLGGPFTVEVPRCRRAGSDAEGDWSRPGTSCGGDGWPISRRSA